MHTYSDRNLKKMRPLSSESISHSGVPITNAEVKTRISDLIGSYGYAYPHGIL